MLIVNDSVRLYTNLIFLNCFMVGKIQSASLAKTGDEARAGRLNPEISSHAGSQDSVLKVNKQVISIINWFCACEYSILVSYFYFMDM